MSVYVSLGHHGFWGYSYSFDWNQVLSGCLEASNDPIKILLVHPGDIRHILQTVAQRRRSRADGTLRPIHFYLLETPIEVLARDLLLLEIVNDYEVPIRQRATIFLEIFGNCKVQDRTSRYIEQLGYQMRSLIVDGSGRLEGIADLSLLKYRDRDELEAVFKSYSCSVQFDIDNLRNHRLRGYYGDRFDSRVSVADWDYHASIRPTASIIHVKQYKEWRMTGIAFEFGDQEYNAPNRTLMSYTEGTMKKGKDKGLKKEVKGFWGDIVASPYFSLGIDTNISNEFASGLFEILNKNTGTEQHRHHVVEVSLYNMFSYFWEIETGEVYAMTKANDIFSGLGSEARLKGAQGASAEPSEEAEAGAETKEEEEKEKDGAEEEATIEDFILEDVDEANEGATDPAASAPHTSLEKIVEEREGQEEEGAEPAGTAGTATLSEEDVIKERKELAAALKRAECIVECWSGIKVFPLLGSLKDTIGKPKFQNLFDGAFISVRSAQCINSTELFESLKVGAMVVAETSKHIIPLNNSERQALDSKIEEFAQGNNLRKISAPISRRRRDENDLKDDLMFFQK